MTQPVLRFHAAKLRVKVDAWREYERRRRAWMLAHPGATPDDYERAVRAIAQELGL